MIDRFVDLEEIRLQLKPYYSAMGRPSIDPELMIRMLIAHLKRILKLDRLRLRGPNGAKDEFHLAATAQNLRKLAKLSIQGALQAAG